MKGIFRAQFALILLIGSVGLLPTQPAVAAAPEAVLYQAGGTVIEAEVSAADNKLAWCNDPNRREPFGSKKIDQGRCMTFRYQVPAGGINSATLHIAIDSNLGADQDTDATVIAVGKAYGDINYSSWCRGDFPGCVVMHGGFVGNEPSLDLDLFNLKCDPKVPTLPDGAQEGVIAQVRTGTIHVLLEDDTAVYRAQLVINGPPLATCGQSNRPNPGVAPGTGTGSGTSTGTGTSSGTATGATLPTPPFGSAEPSNVGGMTLQAAQRRVLPGGLVEVPVYLVKGANLANMNFTVSYDNGVAVPEGNPVQGYLVDSALFSSNPRDAGLIRAGFAQTSGLSGTGVVTYIPFRAVGKPGTKTELKLTVTTINNPDGKVPLIDKISGSIEILAPDGWKVGDCDGDGNLTAIDARCALEVSVNLRPAVARLDIDNSGDTTSRDATLILQAARPIALVR